MTLGLSSGRFAKTCCSVSVCQEKNPQTKKELELKQATENVSATIESTQHFPISFCFIYFLKIIHFSFE